MSVTPNSSALTSEPTCGEAFPDLTPQVHQNLPGDAPKLIPPTCCVARFSGIRHTATQPAVLALSYWALLTPVPGAALFWSHTVTVEQEPVHPEMQSPACSPTKATTNNALLAKILVFIHYLKIPTLTHIIINTKSNQILTKTESKFPKAASP